jgi:predicted acyltransferase
MIRRSLILFALGVALSALKQHQLVLAGVLQHIAVTSLVAWFILRLPRRAQYGVAIAILVGCAAIGIAGGFAQGDTIDRAIDMALFGRDTAEGFLVMVCSVVNVLAGAWVGRWIKQGDPARIMRELATWTVVPLALGLMLVPWIPINKRLWTPSYALVGIACAAAITLAVFWLVDVRGIRRGLTWLRELGANPLAVYVACTALAALVPDEVRLRIVRDMSGPLPVAVASVVWSCFWILLARVIAHALWKRKILVKL